MNVWVVYFSTTGYEVVINLDNCFTHIKTWVAAFKSKNDTQAYAAWRNL